MKERMFDLTMVIFLVLFTPFLLLFLQVQSFLFLSLRSVKDVPLKLDES